MCAGKADLGWHIHEMHETEHWLHNSSHTGKHGELVWVAFM
jgi:hypothetical protein